MSLCTENELSLVRYVVVGERHGFVEDGAAVEQLHREVGWIHGADPSAQVLFQFLHRAHSSHTKADGCQVGRLRENSLRGRVSYERHADLVAAQLDPLFLTLELPTGAGAARITLLQLSLLRSVLLQD